MTEGNNFFFLETVELIQTEKFRCKKGYFQKETKEYMIEET